MCRLVHTAGKATKSPAPQAMVPPDAPPASNAVRPVPSSTWYSSLVASGVVVSDSSGSSTMNAASSAGLVAG